MREHELATIVEASYGREGGTHGIHFMATTPMLDPRIGVPSQLQSSRVIEKGDVLITEISAEHWGYTGQLHRAYAIGASPTDAYGGIHDAAVEAYERIRDALRDGATVSDVLDAAEVLHERGYTVYDDLLHGASQLPPIIQTRRTRRGPGARTSPSAGTWSSSSSRTSSPTTSGWASRSARRSGSPGRASSGCTTTPCGSSLRAPDRARSQAARLPPAYTSAMSGAPRR